MLGVDPAHLACPGTRALAVRALRNVTFACFMGELAACLEMAVLGPRAGARAALDKWAAMRDPDKFAPSVRADADGRAPIHQAVKARNHEAVRRFGIVITVIVK